MSDSRTNAEEYALIQARIAETRAALDAAKFDHAEARKRLTDRVRAYMDARTRWLRRDLSPADRWNGPSFGTTEYDFDVDIIAAGEPTEADHRSCSNGVPRTAPETLVLVTWDQPFRGERDHYAEAFPLRHLLADDWIAALEADHAEAEAAKAKAEAERIAAQWRRKEEHDRKEYERLRAKFAPGGSVCRVCGRPAADHPRNNGACAVYADPEEAP